MQGISSTVTGVAKASSAIQNTPVYNVDPQSGFMPPEEPLARLPIIWEPWESMLDAAVAAKLQLGGKPGLSEREQAISKSWRASVRRMPLLSTTELQSSHILLRRAHHVLTYVMHFYIHSLPPHDPVVIPRALALPILHVSAHLDIPPILTYSDTALYNWIHKHPLPTKVPEIDNLRTRTMFTGLVDEEEFYLCSARIELRGVDALELMRVTMDEIFIGDQTAVRRITDYLHRMATIINELKTLLMDVRKGCNPETYYNEVRPWFNGEDSDANRRKWIFEGLDDDPSLKVPTELSGPSAGQSSMIHVLDVFLGVDHHSSADRPSFMSRMQTYMPRNHRLFLDHLSSNKRPLRAFVMASADVLLCEVYNLAVVALKEFRDAHMIIATLYILGPARRAARQGEVLERRESNPLLGTGGTELVKFLKDTRTRTSETIIP
ncbi:hypothetical protein DXG01_007069 [Tephrocybe rancida]|nr:hypothetical protein DXG01_007069 [Tephrocybe rancida]